MRFTTRGFFATLTGTLLTGLAGAPAFADDTEIFFSQTNTGAAANILMILDTSGSMNDLVTSTEPYDPSKTYTANKCGSSFDTKYLYYGTKIPACGSANKISTAQFKCATMGDLSKSTSGYYTGSWIQWGSSATKKTSGSGSKKVTTNTTTYAWGQTLSSSNTTGYVECKDDAGVSGDGSDKTKLYPSTDTYSVVVTTDSKGNVTTSGSVSGSQLTGVWDTTKNYFASGSGTAYTAYSANYLNYFYDSTQTTTKSKMSIMQQAATGLLGSVGGVNVGVMRYNYGGSGGEVLWPVSDIATGKSPMSTLINNWAPAGITPLSETLYEAYLYYSGAAVNFGNSSTAADCTSWNFVNGQCLAAKSYTAHSVAASRTPATATGANYNSPASTSCQKNYIVYLTDGLPNEADKADTAIKNLGVTCDTKAFSGANGGLCTAGLAGYMYKNDLRPGVTGKQNVTSYFIGFGSDFNSGGAPTAAFNYLNNAATAGGGQAFTATSLTELTAVFNQIFSTVLQTNTTFSAPAVTVDNFNRTQTLDDLYFSVFSPRKTYHWPGNVKKYKSNDGVPGNLADMNGAQAVNQSTGFFMDTAQSYWSASVDGGDVTLGGAASNLPDPGSRTIYTYKGSNPSSATAMVKFGTSTITKSDLNVGGSGDPDITDLVNWTLGMDVQDDNNDKSTTDTRHVMGDPLHAQPSVVIYGKSGTTYDTIIFTPTNDGYLHAIDANTGVELWAFIPQEMLPYLKYLYANDDVDKKHYNLDSSISVLMYDINDDGTIDSAAGDKVILYFGTGRNSDTSRYYALDVSDKKNPKFMWSIDASVLPGLGQAWAAPAITRVNISGAAQNSQKFTLVISGGYDSVEDNYSYVSADSVGTHIYMVDALYGTLLWAAGPAATTGMNMVAPRMDHSIPGGVSVQDLDSDQYADRLYVADTAGQLWRFDIWNGQPVAKLVTGGVMASLGTKDESSHTVASTRRFYNEPDVSSIVKPGAKPYLNIAIGSGYRGHPLYTKTQDAFYSIRDYTPFAAMTQAQYDAAPIVVDVKATTSLSPVARPVDVTSVSVNTASTTTSIPDGSAGWEILLNSNGEKVISNSHTFDQTIYVPSYTPPSATDVAASCSGVGTGTNVLFSMSVLDGSAAIDKNKDGTLAPDERRTDLAQGGIAPEVTLMFLNGGEPNKSNVRGFVGPEEFLKTTFKQLRKTYWHEQNGN